MPVSMSDSVFTLLCSLSDIVFILLAADPSTFLSFVC